MPLSYRHYKDTAASARPDSALGIGASVSQRRKLRFPFFHILNDRRVRNQPRSWRTWLYRFRQDPSEPLLPFLRKFWRKPAQNLDTLFLEPLRRPLGLPLTPGWNLPIYLFPFSAKFGVFQSSNPNAANKSSNVSSYICIVGAVVSTSFIAFPFGMPGAYH